jgi:hypothetical protein
MSVNYTENTGKEIYLHRLIRWHLRQVPEMSKVQNKGACCNPCTQEAGRLQAGDHHGLHSETVSKNNK